jgi:hypothetical protein
MFIYDDINFTLWSTKLKFFKRHSSKKNLVTTEVMTWHWSMLYN